MKAPNSWNQEAHKLWSKGDKEAAFKAVLEKLNSYNKKKPRDLLVQFAYYLFLINDYKAAADVFKQAYDTYPNDIEVIRNLSVCLGKANELEESIFYAHKLLELNPDEILAYDTLAQSHQRLGQYKESSEAGTNSLTLKDAHYTKPIPDGWELPKVKPSEYAKGKKNVISFSLFGSQPRYLRGALRNLLLAEDLFPNWELWFYLDNSVPQDFQELITKLGGIIKKQPDGQTLRQKLAWRFEVSDDKDVGYFLIRDIDSVISVRELSAVVEWLQSDMYFHIMRDWWTHTDLILAGMWGGIAGILPNMKEAVQAYSPGLAETPNIDQWFLRDVIWKYVRTSVMSHDRCFDFMSPKRWPVFPTMEQDTHVGMNEIAVKHKNQDSFLEAWIDKYPCLQSQKTFKIRL
ncbi:MAG: tetratricopeptide repeat protein [Alphaproteobacteria bacterium]